MTNSLYALLDSISNSNIQILFIRLNMISPFFKGADLAG